VNKGFEEGREQKELEITCVQLISYREITVKLLNKPCRD
jgi:hypothetical protein